MLRAPEFTLRVTRVASLGEYTHIRVTCPELLGESSSVSLPPTAWVRLWILEGTTEYQRGYTLIERNPPTAEASIYFLHHEPDGPASRWALHAQPGDAIEAQLLGGDRYTYPETGEHLLFVGDLASAPAIADALAAAPPEAPHQVILVAPPQAWNPIAARGTEVVQISPDATEGEIIAAVDSALPHAPIHNWRVWVALEVGPTKAVKRHVLGLGLPKGNLTHQGYWVKGRVMGTARSVDHEA